MKTIVSPRQTALFDPFEGVIGPMGRKMIADGWQGLFRETLLEQMPVATLGEQLHDEGRPTFELHAMIALIMIREFNGWTVPQTHEALLFRADIQYALNLQPGIEVTQRTIERYIARIQKNEAISEEVFSKVTDTLLRRMEVKVNRQRLDSTHILSDMSTMGRARMIGVTLRRFFRKLEKQDSQSQENSPAQAALLDRFTDEMLRRYRKQSDSRIFADANTTELRRLALQQAAEDLWVVINELQHVEPVCHWDSFKQLQTIFSQQCELREEFVQVRQKTGGQVIVNPSDPDATYSGHKGPGHQVQIAETFNEEGLPNFITSAQVETAADNDADAVEKVIEDLQERAIAPEELLADTAYGGDSNVESAKKRGVDLVAPVPGAKKYDAHEIGYDRFELSDDKELVACPAGHAPISTNYNAKQDYVFAQMDVSKCAQCPLLEHCRVQRAKQTRAPTGRIQFSLGTVRSEARRRVEQTPAFREKYRWRSGIEGTNGSLKRRMGLGRLRVRGRPAVKQSILMKLAGWNLLRGVAMRLLQKAEGQIAVTQQF